MFADSTTRIRLTDGGILILQTNEINKVSLATVQPPASQPQSRRVGYLPHEDERSQSVKAGLFVGGGVPLGAFGSSSSSDGGAALAGVSFGGDLAFRIDDHVEIIGTAVACFNPFDTQALGDVSPATVTSSDWLNIWALLGVRVNSSFSPTRFIATGQLGGVFGTTPEIVVRYAGNSGKLEARSGSALGVGLGMGVIVVDRFMVHARYFYGEPSYMSTSSGQVLQYKQATGLLGIYAGMVF